MKNVQFQLNELVNGFKVINKTGITQYTIHNDDYIICFRSDAGTGKNYSLPLWVTNKSTNKQYRSMRFLIKHVGTVQGISNELHAKYVYENKLMWNGYTWVKQDI